MEHIKNRSVGRSILYALVTIPILWSTNRVVNSEIFQKIVKANYDSLTNKTLNEILPHVRGFNEDYVEPGTGYNLRIRKELKNSRLKQLKEKHNWKIEDIIEVYKEINGELKYPQRNTLPIW